MEKPVLAAALAAEFKKINFVEQTGSTNADLLELDFTSAGPAGPVLRWAGHQTAGRGRRGSVWKDQSSGSLTFSVAFERCVSEELPTALSAFSLVSAVVLANQIDLAMPWLLNRIHVKWPNDVLLDGQKAVGILSEAKVHGSIERIVVGCGVNLSRPENVSLDSRALRPIGLIEEPTNWSDEDSQHLVARIALSLKTAYQQFCSDGFEPFRTQWEQYDAFAGQWLELRHNGELIAAGQCCGVDASGALCIESDGIIESYSIGVVSARSGHSPVPNK